MTLMCIHAVYCGKLHIIIALICIFLATNKNELFYIYQLFKICWKSLNLIIIFWLKVESRDP